MKYEPKKKINSYIDFDLLIFKRCRRGISNHRIGRHGFHSISRCWRLYWRFYWCDIRLASSRKRFVRIRREKGKIKKNKMIEKKITFKQKLLLLVIIDMIAFMNIFVPCNLFAPNLGLFLPIPIGISIIVFATCTYSIVYLIDDLLIERKKEEVGKNEERKVK